MTKDFKREEIEKLIDRAAEADDSTDALKFSQAASNAASAVCALETAPTIRERG